MKYILITMLFCFSCTLNKSTKLKSTDYVGQEIRIDGFWHEEDIELDGLIGTGFYYRNGVFLNGGVVSFSDIKVKEDRNRWWDNENIDLGRGMYGVFEIDDDEIYLERYIPGAGISQTQELYGKILSDTSFRILRIVDNLYNTEEDVNVKMKFYPFSPKPDSTNNFIE